MIVTFVHEGEFVNFTVRNDAGKLCQTGSGPSEADCLTAIRRRFPDVKVAGAIEPEPEPEEEPKEKKAKAKA